MDQQNQQHPPMSGNDDLAKALNDSSLQFEETPMPGVPQPGVVNSTTSDDLKMPTFDPEAGNPDNEPFKAPTPAKPAASLPEPNKPAPEINKPHDKPSKPSQSGNLEDLKSSALEELRPLVGNLKKSLPPEELFDTLLLIIRSTDDQSLLEQAHAAAKEIPDETRRAQALLDVIKEIDYFSSKR